MKRITVTKVQEWYRKTGLFPAYRRWITRDHRACPLTARYIAEDLGTIPEQFVNLGDRAENSAVREYGSGGYVDGFIDGWDGVARLLLPTAEYALGYEDGETVRIEIQTDEVVGLMEDA
jgi:hypothetical protein